MAETTPTDSESALPKGLPIAATGWPTTRRLETVADQRPGGDYGCSLAAGRRLAHDDGVRAAGVEPAGRLRNREHGSAPEDRSDQGEGGNRAGAHPRAL